VFPLFYIFGDFRSLFLEFSWGRFGAISLRDSCWITYEVLVPLCFVILIQQTLRNGFDLCVFGGFHGKMFLRVDFRFLLIEWVLGTELLSKGSPRGSPTIPKVSL
jgi:hypothetical protein